MTGPRSEQTLLVLTDRAAAVRASLEPTAWVVLEELALRSDLIDGQAVAEQSVRTMAESLGRSKDAVARALRQLAAAGLVARAEERHGFSGRFVGVRYVVDLRLAGLRLPADPVTSTDVPPLPPPPPRPPSPFNPPDPPVHPTPNPLF